MAGVAYAMVSQSQALSMISRGYTFIRGREVKVTNPVDIAHFKSSSIYMVREIPLKRQKVAPKEAVETEKAEKPEKKPEKKPAKKKAKKGLFGKNK